MKKWISFMTMAVCAMASVFTIKETVIAGCQHSTCGCGGTWSDDWGGNAQDTCAGTDCWYLKKDYGGCDGHSWYFYRTAEEQSCTSGGKDIYLCYNCAGKKKEFSSPLGHNMGNWKKYDENYHQKECKRGCGHTELGSHRYGAYTDGGDGYQYRYCADCNYKQKKPNEYYVQYRGNPLPGATISSLMAMTKATYGESFNLASGGYTSYYTVSFNSNKGEYASNPAPVVEKMEAKAIFIGWATTPSGGVAYSPGQSVKNLTTVNKGKVELYAKWNKGSIILPSASRPGFNFDGWYTAANGGSFAGGAGSSYTPSANVTLYAHWKDDIPPKIIEFSALPNGWTSGNGYVSFNAWDEGTGISQVTLTRHDVVRGTSSLVDSWSFSGSSSPVSGSYTESMEGVYYYTLHVTDRAGNSVDATSGTVYIDHTAPVIHGLENVVKDWTNIAPVINITTTDYLSGTSYEGSGVVSVVIKSDTGSTVGSGTRSASYTLKSKDEGIHTWTVIIRDAVGHQTSGTVTTKYDITCPGIDGNEVVSVINGQLVSGYCRDNIINQHIDDEVIRSRNNPNSSSGLKSVILYKIKGEDKTSVVTETTKKIFDYPDTHSFFDMYYDINLTDDDVDYYLIVTQDFAGNKTTKKLTSQRSLLRKFHTSIDRGAYDK